MAYGIRWGQRHGSREGSRTRFLLRNATIQKVEIFSGNSINSIKFYLSDGRVYGPFGKCRGMRTEICYRPAEGRGFLAFISGSAGTCVHRLRLHFQAKLAKCSLFGLASPHEQVFSDLNLSGSHGSPQYDIGRKVTAIGVKYGHHVEAIRLRYGQTWSPWHGETRDKFVRREFEFNDRTVSEVHVFTGDYVPINGTYYRDFLINGIKFVMSDDGVIGPFGQCTGTHQVAAFQPYNEQGPLHYLTLDKEPQKGFLSFVEGRTIRGCLNSLQFCFEPFASYDSGLNHY